MQRALYIAYVTGRAGNSMLTLYMGDGILVGTDVGMGRYDGTVEVTPEGAYKGVLNFWLPAGRPMITGGVAPPDMPPIALPFEFPPNFADGRVIPIQTPLGPLNAKFEKLRDLP